MVKTKVYLEGEGNMTRDDCLKMKDVLNIARKLKQEKISTISLWYNECEYVDSRTSKMCFTLGIQNPWQTKMCDLDHKSLVACDAIFGTNKYKLSVHYISFF